MDCHFLLQEIFPRRDGPRVSYASCLGWLVLYHERHLDIGFLQCKAKAGFLGLIHADKSPKDLRNFFLEGFSLALPLHSCCPSTHSEAVSRQQHHFFFFANRVPADPTATSSSTGFLMQAQLHCGRSRALTPLEPSVYIPARTLSFLQAWLLGSQVGSNYKSK